MRAIKLTLAEVKAKGREAFIKGRLSCQAPNPIDRLCQYRTDADAGYRPCVIGAALSDERGNYLEDSAGGGSFCDMIERGHFIVDPAERPALEELQDTHDIACHENCNPTDYLKLAKLLDVPPELIPPRVERQP